VRSFASHRERSAPLAASFRREDVVLGKAAFLVERTFSTFAGNIPLTRHVAVASHHRSPSSEMPPLLLAAHSWFSQLTQYEIVPNSHTDLKIDGYPWRSFSSRIHMISRARKELRHSAVPPETRESVDDLHHDAYGRIHYDRAIVHYRVTVVAAHAEFGRNIVIFDGSW
jgi:hypothetical protein